MSSYAKILQDLTFLPGILESYGGFLLFVDTNGLPAQLVYGLTKQEVSSVLSGIASYEDDFNSDHDIKVSHQFGDLTDKYRCWVRKHESGYYITGLPKDIIYTSSLNLMPIGILKLDQHWMAIHSNAFLEIILGVNQHELLERNWLNYLDPDEIVKARKFLLTSKTLNNPYEFEQSVMTPLGREITVSVQISADYGTGSSGIEGYMVLVSDITEQEEAQRKIVFAANHDPLTKLPNRRALNEFIERHINPVSIKSWVLVFIDLDGFKQINDTLGHAVGDKLLVEVSDRLSGFIRRGEFICRNGGDEFLMVMANTPYSVLANRITELSLLVNQDVLIDKHEIHMKASVGAIPGEVLTEYHPPQAQKSSIVELWFTVADAAMYFAKHKMKSHWCIADMSFIHKVFNHLEHKQHIETCVLNKNIDIYFQPIDKLYALEALTRFKGPLQGSSPENIINAAIEIGCHMGLFNLMAEQGVKVYAKLFHASSLQSDEFPYLNINLEAPQVIDKDFIDNFVQHLKQEGLSPEQVYIEVSEKMMMFDLSDMVSAFNQIKQYGSNYW
ncbi:hypothetical protein C2869_00740 [Saccharobesus litoralis]|uniref:Diguanylate cyclase n=1 Tax=Saccharobesus litoralis TaxID=2172099 RepID=A0A2S0VLI7_9ALTE|nr:diguanylate cyclase [Saccharobesus litoralis]AWB65055.1 hypothetical protein C2869_00740 [Saccharobesus litoralis]